MLQAANVLAASGLDLFAEPEVIEKAKVEWEKRLDSRSYQSLLPEDARPPLGINATTMEKFSKKK